MWSICNVQDNITAYMNLFGAVRSYKELIFQMNRVKIFVPQDLPSEVGVKSKVSCSTSAQPKKILAWYVALNSKPSEGKISSIPQIKWRCPPVVSCFSKILIQYFLFLKGGFDVT